ncbi:MAG: hypothetical protein GY754_01710 [bacterium]|nr:hypothetical protein [bacterium]
MNMIKLISALVTAALLIFTTAIPSFSQPADEADAEITEETAAENGESEDESESEEEGDDDIFSEDGPGFKISGQYKDLFVYTTTDTYYGDNSLTTEKKHMPTNLKRIRLTPEFKYADFLLVHVDYDNEIILSSFNKSYEFDSYWRDSGYNDLVDMSWDPYYNEDIYYRTKLHRAWAKITISDLTMTIGRQQIRFGSGRLWNPLDILSPVSPTFVEGAEEQKGTDALKLDYYFSELMELSLVYSQKRYNNEISEISLKNSNSLARFKVGLKDTDVAALCGWVSRRVTAGVDVSTTLFDGALRGSGIYSNPEDAAQEREPYFQANLGYDYSFKNSFSVLFEYFYNGNSLNHNTELKTAMVQSFFTGTTQDNYFLLSNQLITYNRHYIGLALGYEFYALLRGDLFTIVDLEEGGFFFSPSLKYNMMENLDITAGMMLAYVAGDTANSDFGQFHNDFMYYTSLSFYF